ncbi:MAG: M14 family metallopeptidase [Oligoflexia bacterium]|nr:M14 family metallopeptidase [Oligoflexia bacterium]
MLRLLFTINLTILSLLPSMSFAHSNLEEPNLYWASITAETKEKRTELVNQGFSIETIVEDTSYGFANQEILDSLKLQGFDVKAEFPAAEFIRPQDFPNNDSVYHNYAELTDELRKLVAQYPKLAHMDTIGKTLEGREMWVVRINPNVDSTFEQSGTPGIVFMGGHHAREHLSVEIPLLMLTHLLKNYNVDQTITNLINTRDIYFIPQVNADGSEYDIESGSYRHWRKNRKQNDARCFGVDLNRNYSFQWGTGGSSTNPCSDVFMGAAPFSEPETQAIKLFVETRPNLKILLSFHTFSELILYPWGHKYDSISDARDLGAYEKMATTMARWNKYTPQQASDLYIASGDTTDWSYGTLGIFSFTFELSPRNMWGGGGFYPGPGAIQTTFNANLKPVLYLIDLADDPHRAVTAPETTLFFRDQVTKL